jgi:hypothetical protein
MGSSAYLLQIRINMRDTRKWILSEVCLPTQGQKIYYFCDRLGIFRGEFHVDNSSIANPNKFMSDYGILDADDVQYWMPYDHGMKDMIPLPPNYRLVDMNTSQPMINSGTDSYLSDRYAEVYSGYESIDLPLDKQQLIFSYEIMGDIK